MLEDRVIIREVIENWAIWRDQGDWERFATVWHPDAVMVATWFQGLATDFIEASKAAWRRGAMVQHVLGGSSIELCGDRAIAQTRMTICVRTTVDGVLCDATCLGRFYDFFEKRQGLWAIALRSPIYEKDRLDPVDPGARLALDEAALSQFPAGYRHLAYAQSKSGQTVAKDLPGLRGAEVEQLYADGFAWLRGKPIRKGAT